MNNAPRYPSIRCTVIVPTYRRAAALRGCLEALRAQSLDARDFEVILVDDGGDQPLDGLVRVFARSLQLTLLRQENTGPAAARNLGAHHARGDRLAFVDDDCRPEPEWLATLLAAADDDGRPALMLGGDTPNLLHDNPYSAASQGIQDIVYRHYNADHRRARFFASNNMLVSRDAFLALGGFDPSFRTSEDRDLCDRWRQAGHPMVYLPAARVGHAHPLTLWSFCRQHFGYGRGARRYHRARARRGCGTLIEESGFHLDLRNWLLEPLARVPSRQALGLAALLLLWQAANAAGFFWELTRPRGTR